MSEGGESPGGPAREAEALAGRGAWSDLLALLRGEGRETLLGSPKLAYRYGEALYHTGRMRELREHAEGYLSAARRASDARGAMQALNLAGIAAFELGEPAEAARRWSDLLELAEAEGDAEMMARAANNLGAVANLRGDCERALAQYQLALPLYQRTGRVRGQAQTHHNLGISYRDLGRLEEAEREFRRAEELAESIGYRPVRVMSLIGRAELELREADPEMAERLASRGVADARELEDPILEAEARRVRGLVRGSDGVEELEEALRLAEEAGNRLLVAETSRDLGRTLVESGSPGEGRAALARAREIFLELGAEREAERAAEGVKDHE